MNGGKPRFGDAAARGLGRTSPSAGPIKSREVSAGPAGWALLGLAVLLAGCASAPATRFHSLLPAPAPLAAGSTAANVAPAVRIAGLVLPAALAQPQLLLREADGTLRLLEHERWVAPLDQELRALLLLRLGAADAGAAVAPARAATGAVLGLEVLRWEASATGVRMDAQWHWAADGAPAWHCRWVGEQPAGPNVRSVVQAHARTAALLAEAVAASRAGRCATAGPNA